MNVQNTFVTDAYSVDCLQWTTTMIFSVACYAEVIADVVEIMVADMLSTAIVKA